MNDKKDAYNSNNYKTFIYLFRILTFYIKLDEIMIVTIKVANLLAANISSTLTNLLKPIT